MLGIMWRAIYTGGELDRVRLIYNQKDKTYMGEIKPVGDHYICSLTTLVFLKNKLIPMKTQTFEREDERTAREDIETLIVNMIH